MKVTGKTKLVGLLGYPVKHTASPIFQNAGFEVLNLDWIYLPLEVKPEHLETALKGIKALNFQGVNVTIPHKQEVIKHLDEISEEASIIGAVNTIKIVDDRLVGFNTDGRGFTRSLKEDGKIDPKGKAMFLMGAGGAGRAVAVQSCIEGVGIIYICDKEESHAKDLTGHILAKLKQAKAEFVPFDDTKIRQSLRQSDIFVDATPLGMHKNDRASIDIDWLKPETFVYDLVYDPPETRLLKEAKTKGCKIQNGLGMLLYQGAASFEIWTEKAAPVDVMRKALEKAIYGKIRE